MNDIEIFNEVLEQNEAGAPAKKSVIQNEEKISELNENCVIQKELELVDLFKVEYAETYLEIIKELKESITTDELLNRMKVRLNNNWKVEGGKASKVINYENIIDLNEKISKIAETYQDFRVRIDKGVKEITIEVNEQELQTAGIKLEEKAIDTNFKKIVYYESQIENIIDDNSDYLIKIPIAKIGTWYHPIYGKLEFTQEKLQELERNFNENEAGFEPPLFIGHPEDAEGGAPAEGFLKYTRTENDILYGYWSVNKVIYRDVEDGKYRYSSSEFLSNYISKKTNQAVGSVLIGMALTNRPFIPNLPKNVVLDDTVTRDDLLVFSCHFHDKLDNNKIEEIMPNESEQPQPIMEQSQSQPIMEQSKNETNSNLDTSLNLSEFTVLKEKVNAYAVQLKEVEASYKRQLSEVIEYNKGLQQRIEVYEEEIKQQKLVKKLELVNNLTIPEELKLYYTDKIKIGAFKEAEDSVIESLQKLGETFNKSMLTQYGSNTMTSDLNDSKFSDPYADVIEQNKRFVEQRNK